LIAGATWPYQVIRAKTDTDSDLIQTFCSYGMSSVSVSTSAFTAAIFDSNSDTDSESERSLWLSIFETVLMWENARRWGWGRFPEAPDDRPYESWIGHNPLS